MSLEVGPLCPATKRREAYDTDGAGVCNEATKPLGTRPRRLSHKCLARVSFPDCIFREASQDPLEVDEAAQFVPARGPVMGRRVPDRLRLRLVFERRLHEPGDDVVLGVPLIGGSQAGGRSHDAVHVLGAAGGSARLRHTLG